MLSHVLLDTLPLFMRQWRMELADLPDELTPGQFRILFLIQDGHHQASLLAKQTANTPAAISRMIENLVKLGFVERSTSSIDRRQVTLTLSPEGEQVAVRVRRGVEKRFMTYLENLTSNEQQEVERGLHLLQKAFAPKSESL